jgi:hypothetical protein
VGIMCFIIIFCVLISFCTLLCTLHFALFFYFNSSTRMGGFYGMDRRELGCGKLKEDNKVQW